MVITNTGTEEHPIAKARLVAREFNTGEKRGERFAGTPGLMAMRTVISWAMTKREDGAKMSRQLSCMATPGGRCTLSMGLATPRWFGRTIFGRHYLGRL